jgi:LCCL domain-containing protein
MRRLIATGIAALALVAAAQGTGESFGFTAALAGTNGHASFTATLTGTSLAWKLTFTGPASSADLGGKALCRPCRSPAKGKVVLTAAGAKLLQQGKATARLHTPAGVLSGRVKLDAVTGPSGAPGATTTKPSSSSGPAGSSWTSTAVALRGQNGNRFEFVCPPNASADAGPVWGGGTEYFTDTSAVCPAAVITGDILLQAGGLVVIEIRAGQPSYVGTSGNGITSQSSGPAAGSFVVIHDS